MILKSLMGLVNFPNFQSLKLLALFYGKDVC